MGRKYSFDSIIQDVLKEGYIVTDDSCLTRCDSLLEVQCPKGHKYKTRYTWWKSGRRCKECYKLRNKLNTTYVTKEFQKEHYVLLDNYLNNKQKLNFLCPKGHYSSLTWKSWNRGCRCPACSGNVRLDLRYIASKFMEEGYTLLSEIYVNSSTKLQYKCPKGHVNNTPFDAWRAGARCPDCYSISRFGEGHPNWKGGISKNPYCDVFKNKEYRNYLKDRDNNICRNPYCFHRDNLLTLHHIDYNKQNNHPNNLITVCRNCNIRANIDREWHKEWYSILMHRRFNNKT